MRLRWLEMNKFRNYSQQFLEPGQSLNILSGANAQGKTNILEAIYYLCIGKSFRALKDSEMILWESGFSQIRSLFETGGRELEVKLWLGRGQRKITVNGAPSKGYPCGWPGVVLFMPEDLRLVKGSPQARRNFLDNEIGPLNNEYGYYLSRYQRVLQQRNNLLREIKEGKQNKETLSLWNEQLIEYGAKLIYFRLLLLKKVNQAVKGIYGELTEGKEEVSLRYGSSLELEYLRNEQEISEIFHQVIHKAEREEISRGQSIIGPHRDDLILLINGRETRLYGSQGQHRSLVLALKLTLVQIWYNETGEYPMLLLDDVLSELDRHRQKSLLNRISNEVQTFITSSVFADLDTAAGAAKKKYIVKDGKIID